MNPEFLFAAWDRVEQGLRAARGVALILDFDGTLAPIQLRPTLVKVTEESRHLLRRLANLPRVCLWIVTGRRSGDLRLRLGTPSLQIVGVYGWKIPPSRERFMNHLYRSTRLLVRGIPGVWLEDKITCFTMHYREASPADTRRAQRLLRDSLPPEVEILRGKGVWEIAPQGLRDKSDTVRQLLSTQPSGTIPVIAGDDTSDEASFAALPEGVTIRVGRSRHTAAKYYVHTPNDMWEFLRRIEEVMS
jgi:trehalose 6-phosphate phosphatase